MAVDPRITKRKVTMTNYRVVIDGDGNPIPVKEQATDYVRPDFLDAYVDNARKQWASVEVSDVPDAGPAGFDGATYVPDVLDVPQAGTYFPPTSGSAAEKALIKSGDAAAIATEGSDAPVLLATLLTDTPEA